MPSYSFTNKRTNLYIFLSAIFLTNTLIAEIIGVKIFSVETLLGTQPAHIHLFGDFVLDFNLTAGAVIWPFVFVTSDIINEYFGKAGVRRISFLTAGFVAYSFVVIFAVTTLPPAQFWLDVNATDGAGQPININNAFQLIFRQGLGIIIGSLTAFLIGQILDVSVFHALRRITGSQKIWLRATGSTLVSQLVDSFVVLGIAFYIFGKMEKPANIRRFFHSAEIGRNFAGVTNSFPSVVTFFSCLFPVSVRQPAGLVTPDSAAPAAPSVSAADT